MGREIIVGSGGNYQTQPNKNFSDRRLCKAASSFPFFFFMSRVGSMLEILAAEVEIVINSATWRKCAEDLELVSERTWCGTGTVGDIGG
jgi:hypothetical protein